MKRLNYFVELSYGVSSTADFVLNVHAARTDVQKVVSERFTVTPAHPAVVQTEPHTGNRLMRFTAVPGDLTIRYSASVEIDHTLGTPQSIGEVPVCRLPVEVLAWLYPSRYCPSDRLYAFADRQFGALPRGYSRVEAIRQWVEHHVTFTPGSTDPSTTALDTWKEARGVCRDYAHLMIALCRACNIPARFVSGIDYGAPTTMGPPDFHAYVEAYLGDRWYLFDPTGMCPALGLLRIGTGRDASEAAFATIFGAVRSGAPVVEIDAVHDPVAGYTRPEPCGLAVSTDRGPRRPGLMLPAGSGRAGMH